MMVGALFGVVILGEPVGVSRLVGCPVLVAGVVLLGTTQQPGWIVRPEPGERVSCRPATSPSKRVGRARKWRSYAFSLQGTAGLILPAKTRSAGVSVALIFH
jgi:hypothetical protein